jgi:clan AA aspartic protease
MGNPMITGVVKTSEGRIRITVRGSQDREQEVEAIVDTGYTASLTLPPALIAALGLRWQTLDTALLADGSECTFDVYEARVLWDGKVRKILIDEADTDPLVGMRLLKGHELRIQVRARGKVSIKRLRRK